MILVEAILGNVGDADWKARARRRGHRLARARPLGSAEEPLSQALGAGAEVAVSLDRGAFLRDGDILLWDGDARRATVARISLRDVMIVHLDGLAAPRRSSRCAPASSWGMRSATSIGRRW